MEDNVDIEVVKKPNYKPSVSVILRKIGEHSGTIKTFSEVRSRWKAPIVSQITGDVVMLSPKALAGELVKKGDVLLKIEDYAYRSKLAEAQQMKVEARINLMQARNAVKQAKEDWERSKLKLKPSDLAMKKPQLELAEAKLKTANTLIEVAKKELGYTQIKAPFSGIITKASVVQGQKINIGDELFYILNQNKLDVIASLSAKQWKNLSQDWSGKSAVIKNDNQQIIAHASIKRGGGFLDPSTRLYKLFLELDDAHSENILAGEFLHIELPGKPVKNSLLIPASAYTQEGIIWYVDENDQLRFFNSEVLFYQGDELIVSIPNEFKNTNVLRIVKTPLASFIAGRNVDPIIKEEPN